MRILSISGGGFQALYGVVLLEKLEERIGPLADHFGLFCGSSAGAIVASAAACRVPMGDLREGFVTRGAAAFQRRSIGWGRDLVKMFSTSKYDPEPLERLVLEIAGNRMLGSLDRHLAVTAARVKDGAAILFNSGSHSDLKIRDVVMASAAAPTMFPAVRVDGDLYADGAIFANAPDLLALDLALSSGMAHARDISMLSVGSMNACPPLNEPDDPNMGVIDWIRGNRIFRTMIGSQVDMTERLARGLMGRHYTRIDADPDFPLRGDVALDKADARAIEAATLAAGDSIPHLEKWIESQGLCDAFSPDP